MSDTLDRLAKEIPERIEAARTNLESGAGEVERLRGELAAYRYIMSIIRPDQKPPVGVATTYQLSGGPRDYA